MSLAIHKQVTRWETITPANGRARYITPSDLMTLQYSSYKMLKNIMLDYFSQKKMGVALVTKVCALRPIFRLRGAYGNYNETTASDLRNPLKQGQGYMFQKPSEISRFPHDVFSQRRNNGRNVHIMEI